MPHVRRRDPAPRVEGGVPGGVLRGPVDAGWRHRYHIHGRA